MKPTYEELSQQLSDSQAALGIATAALNDIASWSEGENVDNSYDEPCSARRARKALEAIKAIEEARHE